SPRGCHPAGTTRPGGFVAWPAWASSAEHRDEAMQRFRRRLSVLHEGDADVVSAGVAAVGLFARDVAAGQHAQSCLAPEPHGHFLTAALGADVQPEKKRTGRPPITEPIANDLIG